MSKLIHSFEQYALLALEKQDRLARLAGEHFFELDLDAGMARFGGNLEFPFQVLGTASDNTLTWLWAWSEEQEDIPERLIQSALELREWGAREGVPEFTGPEIDLNRADGPMIAMIASEVCKASCYYRDAYEGGSLFLLLSGREIDGLPPLDVRRLTFHLKELAAEYELNPRNALLAYLRAKGLTVEESGTTVRSRLANGEALSLEFDEQGRLITEE